MGLTFAVVDIEKGREPLVGRRLKDVKRWLAALPLVDPDRAVQVLGKGLSDLNRSDVDTAFHAAVLELLRPSVEEVSKGLRTLVMKSSLPLQGRAQTRAAELRQLLQAWSNGWNRVLLARAGDSGAGWRDKEGALLVYRALQAMSAQVLDHYLWYQVVPDVSWGSINQLFALALDNKLHLVPLRVQRRGAADTISRLFIQLHLLAMINPYRLARGEAIQVYDLLATWSASCKLTLLPPGWSPAGELLIDLAQAAPAGCWVTPLPAGARALMVDVSGVQKILRQHLVELHKRTADAGASNALAARRQRDMFMRLVSGWGQWRDRASERVACARQVELAVGMSGCHAVLKPAPSAAESAEAASSVQALALVPREIDPWRVAEASKVRIGAPAPGAARFRIDDPGRDVWAYSSALHVPVDGAGAVLLQKTSVAVSATQANESLGGMLLMLNDLKEVHPLVGDLVGVKLRDGAEGAQSGWRLAEVRWMQLGPGQGGMFGVELLAAETIPTQVKALEGAGVGGGYTRALVLEGSGDIPSHGSIVVLAGIYDVGSLLVVEADDVKMRLKLVQLNQSTESFACFDYKLL